MSLRISEDTERKEATKAAKTPPRPPPAPPRKTPTEKPAIAPAPSLKKVPSKKPAAVSSTIKPLNNAASRKQDIAVPKPPPPPIKEPSAKKAQTERGRPLGEIEIDAWEKAEMAKIKEK